MKLSIQELAVQLKNLQDSRESLIKSYETMPSKALEDKIIDLGKLIGTAQYEINAKKFFSNK